MEEIKQVETFEVYLKQVKQKLKNAGYCNKSVPYSEVETLYETFNDSLTFQDFVTFVLEIKWDTYCNAKYLKHDVTVLMTRDCLNNEEIDHLVIRLIQDGYAMNQIDLEKLLYLYSVYGDGLTMKTFAIRVLKLTPGMYRKCRSGSRVWILQNVGDIPSIQEQMKQDGYENFLIQDIGVLELLYQTYGKEFTKKAFFHDVLNITSEQIKKLKRSHTAIPLFQKEDVADIESKLEEYGYKEAMIDYQEFQSLYQLFQHAFLDEFDFAHRGLHLSREDYRRLCSRGGRVTVLKPKKTYPALSELWNILIQENYLEKSISYSIFLKLFQRFGPMLSQEITEVEFATIVLQISKTSFYAMKSGKNAVILKDLTARVIEAIRLKLKASGYGGTKITYSVLKDLHQRYAPFLSERQFAIRVLLLTSDNYDSARRGNRVTILLLRYRLTLEEANQCKNMIQEMGFFNQAIDCKTCDDLYEMLGQSTTRTIFFSDVLEHYYPYDRKNPHMILNQYSNVSEDIKNKLRMLFHSMGLYYHKLSPQKIDDLYLQYGKRFTFSTFLSDILGTNLHRYNEALKYHYSLSVSNSYMKSNMERIYRLYFKEARYYTQEELIYLCQMHHVDLKDFIFYYLLSPSVRKAELYLRDYMAILQSYGKLWFGSGKLSSSVFTKNYDMILSKAKIIVSNLRKKYPMAYSCGEEAIDDIQGALLYLLESGQELEKNFMVYQNPLWERYCYGILRKYIEFCIVKRIRLLKKSSGVSLDTLDDLSNPYDVLFHDSDSVSLMEMLTKELNSGNDFWESIQKVSFYFKVSEDQILSLIDNLMKEYHISKDLSLQKKLSF